DAGDLPPALRQPDRVRPFTAAGVQRGAGRAVGDDLDQTLVGWPAPERIGRSVSLVPELLGEHHVEVGQVVLMWHATTLPQNSPPSDGSPHRVTDPRAE